MAGAFLFSFLLYSRIRYHCPYLFGWDGVQFALSLEHFDVRIGQPHPPGYILYSFSLRVLNAILHDPNTAILTMNVIATALAAFFIGLLVWELSANLQHSHRFWLATGAAAMYLSNPLCWLYSGISEIYAVEAFFSSLLAYLMVVSFRKPRWLILTSIAMAVAGGFRPSTEVALAPAYLLTFWRKDLRTIFLSIGVLVSINAAWLSTLVWLTGGWDTFSFLLLKEANMVQETVSVFRSRMIPILGIQAVGIPITIALVLKCYRIRISLPQSTLLISIVSAVIFLLSVHLAKNGYFLIVVPPLIVITTVWLGTVYQTKALSIGLLGFCILLNFAVFLNPERFDDQGGSLVFWKRLVNDYSSSNKQVIHRRTQQLTRLFSKLRSIRQGKMIFLLLPDSFPNFRIAMYYFPDDDVIVTYPLPCLARDHQKSMIERKFNAGDDDVLVVAAGNEELDYPMSRFNIGDDSYYYSRLSSMPRHFEIGDFWFNNPAAAKDEK